MSAPCETNDLLVFSHLRWDLMVQRPHHLLSRFAKHRRVYYMEDPVFGMTEVPRIHLKETQEGVQIVIPYLPAGIKDQDLELAMKDIVDDLVFDENLSKMTLWYYSPKAHSYSSHLDASTIIYDCTENFDPELQKKILSKANLVFTSGQALYESLKVFHHNIHDLPGSVDYAHFSQARLQLVEPDDQINIPRPRIGFHGVIDDRLDFALVEEIATKCPEMQFIFLGPIVGVDPAALPCRHNIFYLGKKDYHVLPLYLSGWDCAMIPFLTGESGGRPGTLKIPEYLASGLPVISVPVPEVEKLDGEKDIIRIATSAEEFHLAIESALESRRQGHDWLLRVDAALSLNSWEEIFLEMARLERNIGTTVVPEHIKSVLDPVKVSAGGVI